ncbi:NUDIX hydrolase [Nocardia donostiensis]|uniref:DNA mismatch repair protein MutT n=1 Tax=Nocardia donostiensis TaxID=1538463 RepID=A0A1V2TM25_9NOCA|nr:NUDIX domain-containing protein [Nocardia donostiensis]ONM50590.1 DNA mismatch repair protein MutT [Nocardia donostiensis]OQS20765.1 DNA mismatch repair protein MutT [Nocardia donostiensis]
MIRTAALAHIRDRRLIQTRPVGKSVFYMAGGKIDPGETPVAALHREVREELGVGVTAVHELGIFEAAAYGHPAGTRLHMTCFTADLTDEPHPTSEIAELRYFTGSEYSAMNDVAPGSLMVFRHLHDLGLIDW